MLLLRALVGRLAIALPALLGAAGAEASSYMHSSEQWYYRGSLGYSTATQAWDLDSELQDIGCRSQRTSFSNQLEYGYSYYYNLFGNLGLTDSRCGDSSKTGLGDLNFGVRGRLNPYQNHRSWEIDATIPLQRGEDGVARTGCGVFGLGASVDRTDRLAPWISVGYGASLKLWESPLAHQAKVKAQGSGPLGTRGNTRWSWYTGFSYELPLTDRPSDPAASVDDCGTQAEVVRGAFELKYRYTRRTTLGCGVNGALWGQDVSRSNGFSCAISRLWE